MPAIDKCMWGINLEGGIESSPFGVTKFSFSSFQFVSSSIETRSDSEESDTIFIDNSYLIKA